MSDFRVTEAEPELTVEDQNRSNVETDDLQGILSRFTQTKEETLEELVNGMIYLKMDDIQNSRCPAVIYNACSSSKQNHPDTVKNCLDDGSKRPWQQVNPYERLPAPETGSLSSTCQAGCDTHNQATDDIEEEVPVDDEDMKEKHTCILFRDRPRSLTKFDNFMLSEDDQSSELHLNVINEGNGENGNWLPSTGYVASFAADENKEQLQEISKHALDANDEEQSFTASASEFHSDLSPSSSSRADSVTEVSGAVTKPEHNAPDCEDFDMNTVTDARGLHPGEVEEQEETGLLPVVQNVRVMTFSMKVASHSGDGKEAIGCSKTDSKDCSDEVSPFVLDEEFDYDNVQQTPKFTEDDITYLKSFLPKQNP